LHNFVPKGLKEAFFSRFLTALSTSGAEGQQCQGKGIFPVPPSKRRLNQPNKLPIIGNYLLLNNKSNSTI